MPPEKAVLPYFCGQHRFLLTRKRLFLITFGICGVVAIYIASWLWLAATGVKGGDVMAGTLYWERSPNIRDSWVRSFYQPAYRLDRMLRPNYWTGKEYWWGKKPAA